MIQTTNARNLDQLLTAQELADRHRKAVGSLGNERCAGIGVAWIKLGGAVRYRLSDVIAYEEAGRVGAT